MGDDTVDEASRPQKNSCEQQPSAADIMLMQAQGKEIPDRKPIQVNIQKTPEIDMVISSVVQARKNQSDAMGNRNKNLAAQVLKIYAVINGIAGIWALTLFERMGTLAIVLALASVVAS